MKTHEFDVLSFLAGLFMTGLGLTFLLLPEIDDVVGVLTDAGAWFWPVVLIVAGIAVLVPAIVRSNSPDGVTDEEDQAARGPTVR